MPTEKPLPPPYPPLTPDEKERLAALAYEMITGADYLRLHEEGALVEAWIPFHTTGDEQLVRRLVPALS